MITLTILDILDLWALMETLPLNQVNVAISIIPNSSHLLSATISLMTNHQSSADQLREKDLLNVPMPVLSVLKHERFNQSDTMTKLL